PDDGAEQPAAGAGGEDGQGDAGEIDHAGALDGGCQRILVIGEQFRSRGVTPIGEVAITLFLVDHVEAGAAAGHGADMAGADIVLVEKGTDVAGIAIFAEAGEVIDRPVLAEQRAHVPGSVERVASIAEAVLAVLATAHLYHAFTDADEALLCQARSSLLQAGLCR